MKDTASRIAMVAGEASGDLLGAHLLAALRSRLAGLSAEGIGGPRMQAEGFESLFSMETLSVRGYAEVLRHYRKIMGVRRSLLERFLDRRPDLFIGVDASDFNLELERRLRANGVPTLHYVSPSVWAWRGWRMRRIARAVSHILVLFPFELPIYRQAGIPATYVGHPLADEIPMDVDKLAAREQLRIGSAATVVALLPGSRQSELRYMADIFVQTAQRLHAKQPEIRFVCPTVSRPTRELFEQALARNGAQELPLKLMFGHSHEALAAADVALVASGTATLEAALLKTPLVITYRQAALTWQLMKRMLYLPYIGLPNVLAGERLVDEYLQEQATPESLSRALLALLGDHERKRRQIDRFREIHASLRQGTAQKAADAALALLDGAHGRRAA